jgi:TolB-like protein/Tfp pilus assembly protein PilF
MGVTEQIAQGKGRRLDSWKAIAQYLDRDVRSVQRWERERSLPVHRLPGDKTSAVFAYQSELDQWLLSRGNESTPGTISSELLSATPRGIETGSGPSHKKLTPSSLIWMAVSLGFVLLIFVGLRLGPSNFWPRQPPASPSIAVLPMENLSGDPAQDYFADGFTDELVTELARIRSLRVISRTSTMAFKGSRKTVPEIAGQLHVRYILEGSVARDAQRVRVIAQLIDAATDTHVSARTYNADVKDIFDVQGRISRAIADDVRIDLSPEEKTRLTAIHPVDPEAHDLYLRASYQFAQQTPDSIRQSLALFRAAIMKDPSFALAYVGVAEAEASLLQITAESPEETVRQEKDALSKALDLDPHLGDARGLLASIAYYHDWNWPLAEREFRLAIAEGAQAPTEQRFGVVLATRGRADEATAHLQRALELDPLGKSPRVSQFFGLYFQRKYADARRELNDLLATSPNFLAGHVMLANVARVQNDCAQSAVEAGWVEKHYPSPMADFVSALASSCRGNDADARRSLESAAASKGHLLASPYQIALGYASTGDRDAALSWLRRSADMREPQVLYIKVDPLFDSIRSDPSFIALEKRVSLLQ